ncbi:MAG: PQQ-dependent sugar dehydrogenase [Fimbriimonas sp.]
MAIRLHLALAFLGASVACTYSSKAEEAPRSPAPPTPQQGRAVNVTRLYNDTCAKCHGENGQGGGGGTKSLLNRDKFDQKWDRPFFDAIKNGVPDFGMEAYGGTLSDPEIWALVVHIRELQAGALRRESGSPKPDESGVYKGQHHDFKVEDVLTSGLSTPWGIDWLKDGRMLVTNRPGSLLVVKDGKTTSVEGLPKSVEYGQGGLMDVAVHPRNGWIYLGFAEPAESGGGAQTKIVRGKIAFAGDKATWTDTQTIYQAPAESYTRAGVHFGTRIVFDKGFVYFAIGERGGMMAAQDPKTSIGKIFRVTEDGKIPADNPFGNAVWSLGHRNPQGLTMDLNGNLWDTEHGPRGGDEVNLITKGANYGWPTHAFSINYNDSPFVTPWPKEGEKINLPAFRWLPSIGASGLDVARGNAFPKWKGDLLAGGLAGANLDRLRMKDGKLVEREELLHGLGRVREVAVGPDGNVYVALNGPDKIIRLVPAK